MTHASILYAPTNTRIALTVSGASQLARVAIRCWLAWMVPRFHTQPSIVVVVGHIVVLAADSRKPLFAKLWSNLEFGDGVSSTIYVVGKFDDDTFFK